jgi:hypothetical protein
MELDPNVSSCGWLKPLGPERIELTPNAAAGAVKTRRKRTIVRHRDRSRAWQVRVRRLAADDLELAENRQ